MREEALQMTPCRRRRASFMLYTDSRSTISMLATGPSSQHEAIGHRIWHELWLSARAGMHVHLQFVYSHSGTARNELADWAASRAFARPPGAAPSWWKDAARWTTYSEGKVPLAPIPTCPGPRTLLPDAHRSTSVRWARIRTQETMEFGMLPRRLGFIRDAACRWCCGGVFAIRAHEVPPAPRPRSTDPIQCPSCGVTLANLKSLRTHWQSRHPADELPEHLRSRSTPGPLLHGPPQAGWLRCRWCQYLHPAAHEAHALAEVPTSRRTAWFAALIVHKIVRLAMCNAAQRARMRSQQPTSHSFLALGRKKLWRMFVCTARRSRICNRDGSTPKTR
eukprot:PhM_4_TR2092/c0_g1_i10/m.29356